MGIGFRELLIVLPLLLLYFVPFFVARSRKHPQKLPILVVNLLLGWTLIGWAAAMAWSLWNFDKSAKVA